MSASKDSPTTDEPVTFWQRAASHQNKITLLGAGLAFAITAIAIGEYSLSLIGWAVAALAAGQLWSYWGTHDFEAANRGGGE